MYDILMTFRMKKQMYEHNLQELDMVRMQYLNLLNKISAHQVNLSSSWGSPQQLEMLSGLNQMQVAQEQLQKHMEFLDFKLKALYSEMHNL